MGRILKLQNLWKGLSGAILGIAPVSLMKVYFLSLRTIIIWRLPSSSKWDVRKRGRESGVWVSCLNEKAVANAASVFPVLPREWSRVFLSLFSRHNNSSNHLRTFISNFYLSRARWWWSSEFLGPLEKLPGCQQVVEKRGKRWLYQQIVYYSIRREKRRELRTFLMVWISRLPYERKNSPLLLLHQVSVSLTSF